MHANASKIHVANLSLGGPLSTTVNKAVDQCVQAGVVMVVDNLVRPLILQRGMQLHPMVLLFAVLGGVVAFGPIGIIAGPMVLDPEGNVISAGAMCTSDTGTRDLFRGLPFSTTAEAAAQVDTVPAAA